MMTGDEVMELMEEYIEVTEMISDILEGELEVALVDGKGKIINLEEILPDHKINKTISKTIASELAYYKQDLRKQIKENI